MRFSLLFPLMLVAVGALTLLLGNAPAAGVNSPPAGLVGGAMESPLEPVGDRAVDLAIEAQVGQAAIGPADREPAAPATDQPAVAATPIFFMPVDGVSVAEVPSSFGDPRGDRLHEGIDIMAERGTPVRAAAPGTVRRVTNSARGGLSVTIIGDDGLRYFYTHFDSFPPGLATGQRVGLDSVIGYVGNSGNASGTAPHLHFAVYRPIEGDRYSWRAFDPLPFLIDRSPASGE